MIEKVKFNPYALGINSSKVYCKCPSGLQNSLQLHGINSSKVYCKCFYFPVVIKTYSVLIVAKCIVNIKSIDTRENLVGSINSSKVYCKSVLRQFLHRILPCINSSKVYCKFPFIQSKKTSFIVLIVAKCIVNGYEWEEEMQFNLVLIVAKCIVNYKIGFYFIRDSKY